MQIEEKIQYAKDYDYTQDYKLNGYVDAKDTVSNWCVAEVIEVFEESNSIRVHYEGWTQRYDEVSCQPNKYRLSKETLKKQGLSEDGLLATPDKRKQHSESFKSTMSTTIT